MRLQHLPAGRRTALCNGVLRRLLGLGELGPVVLSPNPFFIPGPPSLDGPGAVRTSTRRAVSVIVAGLLLLCGRPTAPAHGQMFPSPAPPKTLDIIVAGGPCGSLDGEAFTCSFD